MLDSLLSFANKDVEKDTTRSFKKFVRRLSADVSLNEAAYKKILKNKYFDFYFIIDNIASEKGREAKIFENFNSLYTEYKLSNEKMYGFHGHFSSTSCMVFFGGGLKRGHVHGRTADAHPMTAVENPVKMIDAHATIYKAMGIPANTSYVTEGRPVYVTNNGKGVAVDDMLV